MYRDIRSRVSGRSGGLGEAAQQLAVRHTYYCSLYLHECVVMP